MMRPWLVRTALATLGCWALLSGVTGAALASPQKVEGGIRFTYTDPNAGSVYWAGEFNGWNASSLPMTKDATGVWSVVVALPPGTQQSYKFVADGQWVADPENPVTLGNEGNSVVNLDPQGNLVAGTPTSNTPYSSKIFISGRLIGLYQTLHNDDTGRYELLTPNLDMDLGFKTRISDVLSADWLMNMQSKPSDVEQWRSQLNFDRGALDFVQPHLRIYAYDNQSAGTWDDPLHLVGDIGIYHYGFGYHRQGFRANTDWQGFDTELQYADNFRAGGNSYPAAPAYPADTLRAIRSGSGYVLAPGQTANATPINLSDADEDVIALRTRRTLPGGFRVGALGRMDRGFNLGATSLVTVTGPRAVQAAFGQFQEQWFAGGGEAQWTGKDEFAGVKLFGEFLRGVLRMSFINGLVSDVRVTSLDSTGILVNAPTGIETFATVNAAGRHFDLDESNRFRAGGSWTESHGDIVVRADVSHEDHDYPIVPNRLAGFKNSMTSWRLGWDRNWRYYLNREVKTSIDFEQTTFDYDPTTPWNYQLWLPTGNFWLESDEHVVSFDRLTMLGGNDVVTIRPRLEVPIGSPRLRNVAWHPRNITFEYRGTYNSTSLKRQPKYAESLFLIGVDVATKLRLSSDTRWAVYHDPLLQIDHGYLDHFVQLAYEFAPGIKVAISGGVEPTVLDNVPNDYSHIGRDLFLFNLGANATEAASNYYGLGGKIQAAESALARARRVQVRADVRF